MTDTTNPQSINVDKMTVAELESLGYRESVEIKKCAQIIQEARQKLNIHQVNFDLIHAAITAKEKKTTAAPATAKPNRAARRA